MKKRTLFSFLLSLIASSCVVGAPPGFSDGDLWSVPLVAPLENDLLLVPVKIDGKGPFLFMVDPDSSESSIEASLQADLSLYTGLSKRQRVTEDDHLTYIIIAEVKKMTIGDLSIRQMYLRVHDDGTYWSGGRRVRGILGRDVISDSLAFKFDRDQGMMYIGTQGHLKPAQDASKVSFSQSYGVNRRYLSQVLLNDKHKLTMHLDLGARTSMLWAYLSKKFKMPNIPMRAEQVDEYGSKRSFRSGTIAGLLKLGDIQANAIPMLPFSDKRIDEQDFDGIIGQDFWSKYNITVNWHQKSVWLQDRKKDITADADARVARWGNQLAGCATRACLRPRLQRSSAPSETTTAQPTAAAPTAQPTAAAPTAQPTAAAPTAQPSYSLLVTRDAPGTSFAYDALIGAVDDQGALLDMPWFLASFDSGVSETKLEGLAPEYAHAANLVVLDINPVGTRGCNGEQCIFPVRNSR